MTEDDEEDRSERMEQLAAHKRYNMKSLGRLVDSNRMSGSARPPEPNGAPPRAQRPPGAPNGRVGGAQAPRSSPPVPPVAPVAPVTPDVESVPPAPIGETAPPQAPVADLPVPPIPVVDAPVSEVPTVGSRSGVAPVARVVTNVPNGAPATVPAAVPERAPVTVPAGVGDGVDRSDMGGAVTRTGLSGRLEDPFVSRRLARRMIDGEIAPGGRISDPRDVSGIVLALASDVPASIAVSVVRIDEELEIVGDSIDPSIDPALLSTAFSGVFRNVRPAAEILEVGVLGQIQDVIIAGEHVDLILRPLGDRYFLMVLEDRHDARSDLTATRHRMETIAPGLTAMLAQQDGEG